MPHSTSPRVPHRLAMCTVSLIQYRFLAAPFLLHYLQHLFHIFCCRHACMRLPHFHRATDSKRRYLWANHPAIWALALLGLFPTACVFPEHPSCSCVCFRFVFFLESAIYACVLYTYMHTYIKYVYISKHLLIWINLVWWASLSQATILHMNFGFVLKHSSTHIRSKLQNVIRITVSYSLER